MPNPIILYGSSTCSMVPPAREMLQRAGVEYEYVNISFDRDARRRVMEINHGYASVPTLLFPDDSTLTEPSSQALQAKLEAAGFHVAPAKPLQRLLTWLQSPILPISGTVLAAMGLMVGDLALAAAGGAMVTLFGLAVLISRRG